MPEDAFVFDNRSRTPEVGVTVATSRGRIRPWIASAACAWLLAFALAGCNRNVSNTHAGGESGSDQFLSLMNAGKNYLDQGDAHAALATYKKAKAVFPHDPELRLNLANAYLMAGAAEDAVREADDALKLEPNSAAAYFIKGSAYLRLSKPEEAVKALENVAKIDPGEPATFFQLGLARTGLKQWDEAVTAFRTGIGMAPNRLHAVPHYLLGQALLHAGRKDEAQKELELHQAEVEGGAPAINAATFERSKFTQARVPFRLDQPEKEGVRVTFLDASDETLPGGGGDFSGPLGVIDATHTGWTDLFVVENGRGFRLLRNARGIFQPDGAPYPGVGETKVLKMLVGDLQNDRVDDIVVLGEKGSLLFKFAANGPASDVSSLSRLNALHARDGMLVDLDFTGKLDLIAVTADHDLRIFRQTSPLLFNDVTDQSGMPAPRNNAHELRMEDWNRDGIADVIASRETLAPLLLEKQRGGRLVGRELPGGVAGSVFSTGDFDNDLRPDVAVVNDEKISICFNGGERKEIAFPASAGVRQLTAVDYDNDGWLDLWAVGDKIVVWRNAGLAGFQDQTARLGLDKFDRGAVAEVHFADFDLDCDSDAVVALAKGGLRYLRNDGGNANQQIKVRLIGNRSNASGIGCKIEVATGGLRLIRTVHALPVEVGVGKHQKLDSFLVHWFNWAQGSADIGFNCKEPLLALEMTIQEGSCPYLYAWNGTRFDFVTDILGAAPLGLPMAEGHYVEADPEEFVEIGDEATFQVRDGNYEVQITEELREVLYLDEAKLVIVDRDPDSEVHSTDKLLPGKPFPRGALVTLWNEHPLQKAETLEGRDVTAALATVDGRRVSPPQLRSAQLRGLAAPHGVVLDFGELDARKPLVLVMNGWLRFGGGMANVAASHDPSLPFPFPRLEAENAHGVWKPVDVIVGAPAGKTKTIVVALDDRLEPGTRRLRLTEAFEIYWDRIALMEKKANPLTTISFVSPTGADLHFRGFSPIRTLPADCPLTPDYDLVNANSYWTITPGGWCTRYGDVSELIAHRDEALATLNAGDELTLRFALNSLPPKRNGSVREFFLYVDGWDKDSDFHVAAGTRVEPLPFHGMNDQRYGREPRPAFGSDALHEKYNTRWVEGRVLKQIGTR